MKDREIACIYYLAEKNCKLGKEGTFRKKCQVCKDYCPRKGGKPARVNNRRKKKETLDEKYKY